MSDLFPLAAWQDKFEAWHSGHPQDDGSHDVGHFRRVWQNCNLLLRHDAQGADRAVLLAAAYFHDLVNPPKNSPDRARASQLSADAAQILLQDMAYPLDAAQYTNLHHTIAAHSFSAARPTETREAQILQDADRLEALGAIGLARLFSISGQIKSRLWDQDDPLAARRTPDDKTFCLDHIEIKLRRVAETMQTRAGQTIAAERMAFIDDFRARLLSEINP